MERAAFRLVRSAYHGLTFLRGLPRPRDGTFRIYWQSQWLTRWETRLGPAPGEEPADPADPPAPADPAGS